MRTELPHPAILDGGSIKFVDNVRSGSEPEL